ncbi:MULTISPECIES: hypothetical protein [unclassified Psychrobacter]|uniref:hypothetical protein n=1 Tax=unclassified Psychrobacter TaxID=196806 RepID=UPI0008A6B67B|nr:MULTISPECIES: hypothetical protein [unclassified Psychrobacter]AOY43442.1 hypothetical protein AOT82_1063 [Psychrobacter sp. AntiMn-1]BBI66845.1 hypothetical protein PKHYL_10360 [Psychrobacter sp. KH172YL61]
MKSANTEAIAKELREIDLSVDSSNDVPPDDTLKQQYQKNMLERYPDFEAQTASDIAELKHEVSRLSDMNKVMVWLVLGLIVMLTITQTN